MNTVAIIAVIFVVVVLIVFAYFLYQWTKNNLLEPRNLPSDDPDQNQQRSISEKEINAIVDIVLPRVMDCVRFEIQESINHSGSVNKFETSNVRFFRLPKDRVFAEEVVTQADASFKVLNFRENIAKFEYCGGVLNSDLLKGVCTFENSPNNGDTIITTTPGMVKKDNDGNWEVTTPAIIKFV